MPATLPQIHSYFAPPRPSFWYWQDDGQVLVWADGATIAFAPELRPMLLRLASQGLPPFGAIVLLLAACRENWHDLPGRVEFLGELLRALSGFPPGQLFHDTISGLNAIHQLPKELRGTSAGKAAIAATVFEAPAASDRLLPAESVDLCQAFADGLTSEQLSGFNPHSALTILLGDLACLRGGLARLDADSLALRVRTGLDRLLKPAPLEIDPAGLVRSLIAQLQDDEELGGLARLARLLMAAVQLPRALSDPEELPLGGVSDISNRGSLDRLLLSELAHDDLTLAVRVAVNEALYLRREAPPRTPPKQRTLLLDSGLRLWGVPRVFATAVGLALVATADKKLQVRAFRACGRDVLPVDLTTAEGLTAHMAALDHRVHPGEALAMLAGKLFGREQIRSDTPTRALPFGSRLNKGEHGPEETDLVLVTSDDVLADRSFQQLLEQLTLPGFHIATVSRDGRFRLVCRSPRGGKVLREAKLALDEVLRPRAKPSVELIDKHAGARPAIFGIRPFPLLLSCPLEAERAWYVDDFGVLSYTRDGRLLYWSNPAIGARQLCEGLTQGKLHWCSRAAPNGFTTAIIGKFHQRGLQALSIDIDRHDVKSAALQLDEFTPERVFCRDGVAFVLGRKDDRRWINVCSLQNGQLLISRALPPVVWQRDRFFVRLGNATDRAEWLAMSFDGVDLQLNSVLEEHDLKSALLALFDVHGVEGPVGVTVRGHVVWTVDKRTRAVEHGLGNVVRLQAVSRDGLRFVLAELPSGTHTGPKRALVETLAHTSRAIHFEHAGFLEPQLAQVARPRVLRHRFLRIGIDAARRITLVGRRGTHWPIVLDAGNLVLPSKPVPPLGPVQAIEFESFAAHDRGGYALGLAKWPDGSRAWLDHRGLLHLQSSDPAVPQCTIVLAERVLAGWTSDGRVWGAKYFVGDQIPTSAATIYNDVLRPFVERLGSAYWATPGGGER